MRTASAIACLLVVAAPAVALAESAEDAASRARAAYEALDYDGCVKAASQSLKLPGSRAARVDAFRSIGLCKAALGESDAARDAFVEMLGLDPTAQLPKGLSPRFTSALLEARGFWVGKEPVGIALLGDEKKGRTRVLTLRLHDEIQVIDRVAWRSADGDLGEPVKGAEQMELEVPVDVAVAVIALDPNDGVVAEVALPDARPPPPKDEPPVATEATEESSSALTSPWLWAGVGVAAVVVVGVAVAGIAVGALFYEPRTVDLEARVAFADN